MAFLWRKSFKHAPISISIKGPRGIVSHHLQEVSQVYFGGKPTKTQMFNPQLQTLHSSHVKFTERFSRSRRPESKAKCRFCYFKIRTAQLNVFKFVTLHAMHVFFFVSPRWTRSFPDNLNNQKSYFSKRNDCLIFFIALFIFSNTAVLSLTSSSFSLHAYKFIL